MSVQQVIEEKLSQLLDQTVAVMGCGRTDTGVHAKNFILHFDAESLPDQIVYRLNRILPDDISVDQVYIVPDDFHARFDAKSRTYEYTITDHKDPFIRSTALLYPQSIDMVKLQAASNALKHYTDFGSFCKSKSDNKTDRCTIFEALWTASDGRYTFKIKADRFLRNMVRAIVGTLLEINEGLLKPEDLDDIIVSGDRSKAGRSVPAHGLILADVEYDRTEWQKTA